MHVSDIIYARLHRTRALMSGHTHNIAVTVTAKCFLFSQRKKQLTKKKTQQKKICAYVRVCVCAFEWRENHFRHFPCCWIVVYMLRMNGVPAAPHDHDVCWQHRVPSKCIYRITLRVRTQEREKKKNRSKSNEIYLKSFMLKLRRRKEDVGG